jgi:hypothetical protein
MRCPDTTLVSVGDRGVDIYELFHLAIDMVVAWRIYHLANWGERFLMYHVQFLEDTERKALVAYKTENSILPEEPPTL